ncbi:hypothetical protein PGB90_010461 [Kerria lacca]
MGIATKIVNSIRARSLQRRLFKLQLEDRESTEHTDLVLYTDVRWLSRGKFLERFHELLPEITAFLDERGDDTEMLKSEKWLTDLAFLTDITMHLNTINLELQGKGKTIIEMIRAVNAFKSKLQLMIDQLKRKDLKHFPSLKARIPQLNYDTYEAELSNILGQFEMRFYDCSKLANIASFSAFSEMKIIKSKYRNRLTDDHMSSCLRLALSGYAPSYEKYAEDMQYHASTFKVTA